MWLKSAFSFWNLFLRKCKSFGDHTCLYFQCWNFIQPFNRQCVMWLLKTQSWGMQSREGCAWEAEEALTCGPQGKGHCIKQSVYLPADHAWRKIRHLAWQCWHRFKVYVCFAGLVKYMRLDTPHASFNRRLILPTVKVLLIYNRWNLSRDSFLS